MFLGGGGIAVAAAVAPSPAAAQESLTLRFAWPEGSARVTSVTEVTTNAPMMPGGGGSSSTSMAATMTVSRHPEGYRVSYSDYDFGNGLGFADLIDGDTPTEEEMMRFLQGVQQANGDILVSADGDYLRLADPAQLEPIMSLLEQVFEALTREAPMAPLQSMRDRLMDPATWEEMASVGWNSQLARWRGEWTRGEVRQDSTAFPSPLGEGQLVMLEELAWDGFEPCPDGSGECVVMAGTARSDDSYREKVEAMMTDMLSQMGASGDVGVELLEMDMSQTTRLYLRRDTMVPVSMLIDLASKQGMAVMGMEMSVEQTQTSRTTWEWAN